MKPLNTPEQGTNTLPQQERSRNFTTIEPNGEQQAQIEDNRSL
ncbi:hypothetical protein [Pedobacter sp. UC225_65]